MPAQRPRASFEPLAPDFDLKRFVENTPNFGYVDRISCEMLEKQGLDAFEKLVLLHVIVGGKPLVIDGFEDHLDPWTFTPKWLRDNCGEKVENARNITAKEDLPLTIAHYLNNMGLLTNQFFDKPGAWREKTRQRVYLKDIDCPGVWWDKVKEHIPPVLTYLNDCTGENGGPGAVPDPHSTQSGKRLGKGIARAGDLMSSLPADMRAENLMCYIGHEGTYTPAHKEMCASLGQNIMVEASSTVSDDGKAEIPGSSIWFMTESKERHLVSEYWLSVLGHDIEVENHFAQMVAWKKAPFRVHVVEQRPGDFVLIPPLAPHQVWNRGTRTMKVAWNRTTVETLEMAINEALPRAKIVCREEQYKIKAIVYYTLQKYSSLLSQALGLATRMPLRDAQQFLGVGKIRQLQKDFKRLFTLYKQILLSEMFSSEERDAPKNLEYLPFDSNVTCAYCRCNIFNRFLSCPSCKDLLGHSADEDGDPYDVCMDCYAMGRSCACTSGMKWVEQFRWKELATKYETWRRLIIQLNGGPNDKTPLPLDEERKRYDKKTLAEVCKDQLKRRPFKDVKKHADQSKKDEESEEEIVVGDDGQVKKVTKKKSKAWLKNNQPCHVCCHRHPTWKMARCTTCERSWCYGSLFRGWDKMPLQIMEDPNWSCPHCLGICFAGACRRDGKMQVYEPKGTLLGHDTKRVADVRSVEALVDFSVSNLNWLREDDPVNRAESRRLKRARAEADRTKEVDPSQDIDDDDRDMDATQVEMEFSPNHTPIDPALGGVLPLAQRHDAGLDESDLGRRLREANSSLPPSAAVSGSAVVGGAPDGYAAVTSAGYSSFAPTANMYPNPEDSTGYQYPGGEEENAEPSDSSPWVSTKKRRQENTNGEDDADGEDISMQKGRGQKKPRLAAAGFTSYHLAGSAEGPMVSKAKNETQRQSEKEKERKALDKAKAQGRFIMMQAALKGKKRIVKLSLPGDRLGQLLTQQVVKIASQAHAGTAGEAAEHVTDDRDSHANNDEQNDTEGNLLKSDIPPKKTRDDQRRYYEQKVRDGIIVSGGTKKALVPVEKDENYGYTYRQRLPNGKRVRTSMPLTAAASKESRKRKGQRVTEYEEVDIGSEDEEADLENSSFVPINGTNHNRRSLPGYLQGKHADDDPDMPNELPDDWKEGHAHNRPPRQKQDAVDEQLQQEMASTIMPPRKTHHVPPRAAGKRPTVRSVTEEAVVEVEDDTMAHDVVEASATGGADRPQSAGRSRNSGPKNKTATATLAVGGGKPQMQAEAKAAAIAAAQAQSKALAAQRLMEEDNRLAKLQALRMLEDPQSSTNATVGHFSSNTISMPDNATYGEIFDDDDDDYSDGPEEIPAR